MTRGYPEAIAERMGGGMKASQVPHPGSDLAGQERRGQLDRACSIECRISLHGRHRCARLPRASGTAVAHQRALRHVHFSSKNDHHVSLSMP